MTITNDHWTLRTDPNDSLVKELLQAQESLLLQSILKGHTGFRLYADHAEHPDQAVVWDLGHNLHVYVRQGSRPEASLEALVYGQIRQAADSKEQLLDFEIQPFAGTDLKQIAAGFTQHPLMPTDRTFYIADPSVELAGGEPAPADGCTVAAVDAALLDSKYDNVEEIAALIDENWVSRELFLRHGVGSCVIQGAAIVSWCVSDYVVDHRCEVGVETDEDHQRQGYALLAVRHLLGQCKERLVQQVGWHCRNDNVASMKLAEKAGFQLSKPYLSLHGWFNPFDHLLVSGYYHLTQTGHYEQAGRFYDSAFRLAEQEQDSLRTDIFNGPARKWCYYSAACCWSLAGDGARAIGLLEDAIREGWTDAGQLQQDDRLRHAQQQPAWDRLLVGLTG